MTESGGGRGSDPRVDDLRQQLRALGYLDAGVDRFVLAPARHTRKPAAFAVLAGVRIGVLAALLLGPAAAIGLGARLPGLVVSVRDAGVLALYLAAVFFIAFSVLSTLVSLGAASIAGGGAASRAHAVSSAAGWSITLVCLTYLTLWWRTANAGFGWSAPLLTIAALCVAVLISLLLGHAVRMTTLAVVAAGDARALPRLTSRSWRWVVAGGACAFLGAAALLIWTAPAKAESADASPLTVVSTGRRVRLIAVDGFDPVVFRDLSAAGHVPALARATQHARATLRARDTADPARAWTTIATGEPPEVHGVQSIETRRVAGVQGIVSANGSTLARLLGATTDLVRLTRPSVASREQRRVKTLWEVAADAGLRTAVINWWATWPAAGSNIVVSDRAILRLEHGGALDGEIAPAALYETLRDAWPAIRQRAVDRVGTTLTKPGDAAIAAVLQRSAELDQTVLEIAAALPGPARDLDVVYLPGLDIAQHALLADTDGVALGASAVAARVEAIRAYYMFLDRALAHVVEPASDELVMVLTGPGRVHSSDSGLFAMDGHDVAEGASVDADSVAVAPTVLYALGVPLSRELQGAALLSLFDRRFVDRFPARYVATYGAPDAVVAPRAGQPLDQEMIDRLRSLGYVK